MRVTVNGDVRDCGEDLTVAGLLETLEMGSRPCAVEVNRRIVPRRNHPDHGLEDGDTIEIVTLVGGG
ncbi:MAG: thiamine biosynthesis protein ThiS [Planctomycetaceae bacterium]|nr:thiamine biosynthesis protein ThiS [Planctomycetaceae bacterium]